MSVTPYKLRDDKWGIKAEPPGDFEKGDVVDVSTKKGDNYKVVVRARVWGNDERELYAVDRLPDMKKTGNCPMCGKPLADKDIVSEWHGSKRAEQSKAPEQPSADPDDDIPF